MRTWERVFIIDGTSNFRADGFRAVPAGRNPHAGDYEKQVAMALDRLQSNPVGAALLDLMKYDDNTVHIRPLTTVGQALTVPQNAAAASAGLGGATADGSDVHIFWSPNTWRNRRGYDIAGFQKQATPETVLIHEL